MVWTFSVHTAVDIKKGSVINVVCYERVCVEQVCYEWVCYECGLLWTWSVMSGLLWTGLFWMGTILNHWYVFMSHEFQTVYCQRKNPLILKVVLVAIAYVATILTSTV